MTSSSKFPDPCTECGSVVVGEVGDGRGLREKKAADGADVVDGGVQGGARR